MFSFFCEMIDQLEELRIPKKQYIQLLLIHQIMTGFFQWKQDSLYLFSKRSSSELDMEYHHISFLKAYMNYNIWHFTKAFFTNLKIFFFP